MDKVKEVVNKVVHPKSSDTTTTSTTGHHSGVTGTHGTAGPHSSNLSNKADPRVDSDLDGSRNMGATQYGAGSGTAGLTGSHTTGSHNTAGPHRSDALNAADPRVDSDLDGSRNMGATQYGAGATHSTTGTSALGSHSTTGKPTLMEKLDPRIDSDNDGSRNMGMAQQGAGAHHTSTTTGHSSGLTGAHHTSTTPGHSSGLTGTSVGKPTLMEKLDPRIDSDNDGSRNMGMAQHGAGAHHTTSGTTGFGSSTTGATNTGVHNSNLLNRADPRIDSDNDGSRNMGAAQHGAGAYTTSSGIGNTHHTTGSSQPVHSSNLLNKLDPRVDSDNDGSRNMGMAQSGAGAHNTSHTSGY